jgi:hypothetical protein
MRVTTIDELKTYTRDELIELGRYLQGSMRLLPIDSRPSAAMRASRSITCATSSRVGSMPMRTEWRQGCAQKIVTS